MTDYIYIDHTSILKFQAIAYILIDVKIKMEFLHKQVINKINITFK